ncbi:MAG TPA: PKD domain-containing protein [Thermoplasmata archaeon]|nr:PKD domain-containing protein [Thermoplasmata archaeon]
MPSADIRAATEPTLSITGASPSAAGLQWTASSDLVFSDYVLQCSDVGAGGPWSTVTVQTARNATSYFADGLNSNTSYWWRVLEQDSLGVVQSTSNVATARQPDASHLGVALGGSGRASLAWTNHATYAGGVRFRSYEVEEAQGSGAYATKTTVLTPADRSLSLGGLAASTEYRFQIQTVDTCNGTANCGGADPASASPSNSASLLLPSPLSVRASANSTTEPVGAADQFTADASGGTPPYTIGWKFGDGSTATGREVTHPYGSPGNFTVVATVTDLFGTSAQASIRVTVHPIGSTWGDGSGTGNGSSTNGSSPGHPGGGNGGGLPFGSNPSRHNSLGRSFSAWLLPAAVLIVAALAGGLAMLYFYSRSQHGGRGRTKPPASRLSTGARGPTTPNGPTALAGTPAHPGSVPEPTGTEPAEDLDRYFDGVY